MTIRLMCDSDQLDALLPTDLAATYSDLITSGKILADLEARLPNTRLVYIDRGLGDPLNIAHVVDTESGAFTPAQSRAKITEWQRQGRKFCTDYHSEGRDAEISAALAGLSYYNWIAWYDHAVDPNHPNAAVQFANSPMVGEHVDLSLVYDDAWCPGTPSGAWISPALAAVNTIAADAKDVAAILAAHSR